MTRDVFRASRVQTRIVVALLTVLTVASVGLVAWAIVATYLYLSGV